VIKAFYTDPVRPDANATTDQIAAYEARLAEVQARREVLQQHPVAAAPIIAVLNS
jgi:hypothetical protein